MGLIRLFGSTVGPTKPAFASLMIEFVMRTLGSRLQSEAEQLVERNEACSHKKKKRKLASYTTPPTRRHFERKKCALAAP